MKIVFIGSGNLATHLSVALKSAGHTPLQVYSKTLSNACQLAKCLNCDATDDITQVSKEADAYIISIKDDAIAGIIDQLAEGRAEAVFIHTAGSVSIDILAHRASHAAVLYPMQSFTKGRDLDFATIPCFIEASDAIAQTCVTELAESISREVYPLNSETRKKMHLAAVFASNLANHCYRIAEKIVTKEGLDFKLFSPLILETARKATVMSPRQAQTGPMVRNDVQVMQMQLSLLDDPHAKQIYKDMAESIYADK